MSLNSDLFWPISATSLSSSFLQARAQLGAVTLGLFLMQPKSAPGLIDSPELSRLSTPDTSLTFDVARSQRSANFTDDYACQTPPGMPDSRPVSNDDYSLAEILSVPGSNLIEELSAVCHNCRSHGCARPGAPALTLSVLPPLVVLARIESSRVGRSGDLKSAR